MINKIRNNAPTILTTLGCCGVVGTGISAAIATRKANDIFDSEDEPREKFKKCLPLYLPSLGICVSTLGCILGAHHLSMKQQASLITACQLLEATRADYTKQITEYCGEDDAIAINIDIAGGHVDTYVLKDPSKIVFVDDYLKIPFESTIEDIQQAEYELNRTFALRAYASLGDFYRYAGVPETSLADKFGWSFDMGSDMGYEWIDFINTKVENPDGTYFYLIRYPFEPVLNYLDVL